MRACSVGAGRPDFARYHCSTQELLGWATTSELAPIVKVAVSMIALIESLISGLLVSNFLGSPLCIPLAKRSAPVLLL
jgi:hypothetical protein